MNVSQCYDGSHDDRETFFAWNIFHMKLRRKLNVWLSMAKFLTSFVYFSEEICSFQAISEKDIYSKSCISEIPVLLHLHKNLLQLTEKMAILTPFFFHFRGLHVYNEQKPWGKRKFPNKNTEENSRLAGN